MNYILLDKINSPDDLKKLEITELLQLAQEIREYILDVTSQNPGHVGANLGVVELTIAIHYVFNLPYDKVIWDVGHQCYTHKILSGRKEAFKMLRKKGGISGFPDPQESEYDAFIAGHSSTSISAGLGFAISDKLNNVNNRNIIVVIGDGSMTAGQAYEALINVGCHKPNILIILNDNRMSISPNKSAFSEYLFDIATSKTYNKVKNDVWRLLGRFEIAQKFVQNIDNAIKSIVLRHSNIFEALGIRYFGPIDGHNIISLISALNDLKDINGPKLLHVLTQKGKGYKAAEEKQDIFHAPGRFNRQTGDLIKEDDTDKPQNFQYVFGKTLVELAHMYNNIVAITPAMTIGSSLEEFAQKFPNRFFDVGIAEQHAVTFAAALAKNGLKPFCVIYSTFMQRAYDQFIHDVALQKLPVILCIDRAGLVGNDGVTHQGAFDISFFNCVPNTVIAAPKDEIELRNLMYSALFYNVPIIIRYPRESGIHVNWNKPFEKIESFKAEVIEEGENIAIIFAGNLYSEIKNLNEELLPKNIKIGIYNFRFIKPIDEELLHLICNKYRVIITLENNSIIGGLGSIVADFIATNNYNVRLVKLGIPDRFIKHSSVNEQYEECGLDKRSIKDTVLKVVSRYKFN
ncbi:MAG: 1-deoxy-D-xylulose-5-phosphate synthase [Bacteroidales bacterium]|nr:1-deoxy-D-xylulose-5-phosphate synthase [Bacteroidales bacterium]